MKRRAIAGAVTGAIASMLLGNGVYAAPLPATDSSSLGNSNGTLATVPLGGDSRKTATVQVMGTVMVTARKKRNDKLFRSSQSVKTMDQDQIRAAGAVGGVAAAMALVPGVSAQSYGNSGAQKTSYSINGIKVGWGGFSAPLDNGSVSIAFDGVPMVNPGNGLWQSDLIPQSAVLQTMGVTYGPGEVKDRWYTNIGGQLDFVPLQPSEDSGAEIAFTYGSYNAKNAYAMLQTGKHNGWETVLFAGGNKSESFMQSPDGFNQPSRNYAIYAKTRKLLTEGDASFGVYAAFSGANRPLPTPVNPIPGVYTNGHNNGGSLFSQQTTGFYTALNYDVNHKFDSNQIQMVWSKLNLSTSSNSTFHNMAYFVHEAREHFTTLHDYAYDQADPGKNETNKPYSYVIGDKMWTELNLPYNDVALGGYAQYAYYHSREQVYSSLPGIGPNNPDGNYFSDIWDQSDAALFAQDTISPMATLHVTPGVRLVNYNVHFTHNEDSAFPDAVANNPGGNASGFPDAHRNFTKFEPGIGVNWEALSWLAPFASFERTYRQPENGGGGGPYVSENPAGVRLERGDDYQAGTKMHWPQLGSLTNLSATVAYSHLIFSNETLTTALASGPNLILLAHGKSIYNALNVYADANFFHDFYGFVNLGKVDAKFENYENHDGTFHGIPVANTPDYNFNIGFYDMIRLNNGTFFEPRVTYIYTGSQHMFDNSQNITSSKKIPAYGFVNASAELDIPVGDNLMKATLEVDNLMNKRYNSFEYVSSGGAYGGTVGGNGVSNGAGSVLALPGAPRTVYLTLAMEF